MKKKGLYFADSVEQVRGKKTDDKTLNELAKKYGKTGTQILLRWSLQKGTPSFVHPHLLGVWLLSSWLIITGYVPLPKSVTPSRIIENADVYDFELSKEDIEKLATDEYEHLSWDPTVEPLEK